MKTLPAPAGTLSLAEAPIGFRGFGETLASIPGRRCGQLVLAGSSGLLPDVFSSGEAGFHELAARLFMVGYDLTEA